MKYLILIFSVLLFSCTEEKVIQLNMGNNYQDGVIFYLFEPGDTFYKEGETHGLIVSNLTMEHIWGCNSVSINAGDDRIGGGDITNQVIIDKCNDSAALLCSTLKREWYLPNVQEFRLISKNRDVISDLKQEMYWTCNITLDGKAFAINPYNGVTSKIAINQILSIRAIKRF